MQLMHESVSLLRISKYKFQIVTKKCWHMHANCARVCEIPASSPLTAKLKGAPCKVIIGYYMLRSTPGLEYRPHGRGDLSWRKCL